MCVGVLWQEAQKGVGPRREWVLTQYKCQGIDTIQVSSVKCQVSPLSLLWRCSARLGAEAGSSKAGAPVRDQYFGPEGEPPHHRTASRRRYCRASELTRGSSDNATVNPRVPILDGCDPRKTAILYKFLQVRYEVESWNPSYIFLKINPACGWMRHPMHTSRQSIRAAPRPAKGACG